MKITYCMITYNRLHETLQCIARVKPYVDQIIVIDGGSNDDTIFTLRNYPGVDLYIHPWKDNFAEQRTRYLRYAKESGADWVLVSDSDEMFSVDALVNLRKEISNAGKCNTLCFEATDVTLKGEAVVSKRPSKWWKPLLHKLVDGMFYNGLIHEVLERPDGQICKNLPYTYYHIKQEDIIWQRGARNAFISGMNTNKKRSNLWEPFKKMVKDETGIDSWTEFDKYLIAGNIAECIKASLITFKDQNGWDGSSEWRELYKLYFRAYHPEEEPTEYKGTRID